MKKVLSLTLVLALALGCVSFASAEEDKIRLIVWSFSDELKGMIEKYYAPHHPEIEVEFQVYPIDENTYTTRIDNTFGASAAGDEAPDLFTLEAAFVKHYVESDWTGDLKDIGFTDEELAAAFPVMAQIGQNTAGVQKGLSWQATPGVLMYRASLAEKYLGVQTPKEMQKKVEDWDAFLETAEELKAASNGECRMVAGSDDLWNACQYQRSEGWVVDGRLNIDDELLDFEELARYFEQDDLTHKSEAGTEEWFAGMRGELPTLCYFLPTWGLHDTLKPHCAEGWDSTRSDEENLAMLGENTGTYGDWRLTGGPVAFSEGGTWLGINAAKAANADDARKAAMHDLIRFFTLDDDFLTQYARDSGDFVGSQAAAKKILAEGGTPTPFVGGQDPYAIFAAAAALANGSLMSEYDDTINSLWKDYVTTPYTQGEKELEICLAEFMDAVAAAVPTITVEN